MRDSQRQRVYDSESGIPQGKNYPTVVECQQRVNQITRSAWWAKNTPKTYWQVRVHDGRGHRRAMSYGGTIALPKSYRYESIILHELAHEACPRGEKHGPAFTRMFYDLLRRFHSVDAAEAFLVECAVRNVKVQGKRLPRAKVTDEQRADAAEQRRLRAIPRFVVHCADHGVNPSKVGYCVQCRNDLSADLTNVAR